MSKVAVLRKIGMTTVFDKDGKSLAVTVLEALPTGLFEEISTNKFVTLVLGVLNPNKHSKTPQVKELQNKNISGNQKIAIKRLKKDQEHSIDPFLLEAGESVKVRALAKGKGFAGTVKRHNFNTGPKTHGSHNYRQPGSIGSMYPEHVFKGKKMAGRMGGRRVTVNNLKVFLVDPKANIVLVKGPVPGRNGALVELIGVKK